MLKSGLGKKNYEPVGVLNFGKLGLLEGSKRGGTEIADPPSPTLLIENCWAVRLAGKIELEADLGFRPNQPFAAHAKSSQAVTPGLSSFVRVGQQQCDGDLVLCSWSEFGINDRQRLRLTSR